MIPILCRFFPRADHIALLAEHLQKVKPTAEDTDGIIEIIIVKEAYESPLVVLFREHKRWGIRLDGYEAGDDPGWWKRRGFATIEGETYVDPETYEERTVDGPPVRFPVQLPAMIELLSAILSDFMKIPEDQELIATQMDNPDDWPLKIPPIVRPD